MNEIQGWLLDIYADEKELTLWVIGEDGVRHHLHQAFPVTFYAAGPFPRLRKVWQFIKKYPIEARLEKVDRRDLFCGSRELLAVQVHAPASQPKLCRQVIKRFPDLDYYDTDIPLTVRYAAVHDLFPLARCRLVVNEENRVQEIAPLDSPWDIDNEQAPLQVLTIDPDSDPQHAPPRAVIIRSPSSEVRIPIKPYRRLILSIAANLKRHDPDLVLTSWGDTWLFPLLLQICSGEEILFFNPNRDQTRQVLQRKENSYFTYGQVVHRGQQTHLYGR